MSDKFELAQEIIDSCYVECPHCKSLIELSSEVGASVDAPNVPNSVFCSWKCLGRWIAETYEQGKQFEYYLSVPQSG